MSFSVEGGHIVAVENGRVALTTEAPMLNLIPDAAIDLVNYEIEFPSFWFGLAYLQGADSGGGGVEGCTTLSALVEQEWGPLAASPNTLTNAIIGTVPVGTDYLDVRINVNRTVNPSAILGLPFVPAIPPNTWIKLEGGSCVPEKQSGVARLFEIVLDGTNVVLKRYQSVRAGGGFTRENPGPSTGNRNFFYPSTNAPEDYSGKTAVVATLIDNKVSATNTHRPPGKEGSSPSNIPCSMSLGGISYRSVFKGSIRIVPGRISG